MRSVPAVIWSPAVRRTPALRTWRRSGGPCFCGPSTPSRMLFAGGRIGFRRRSRLRRPRFGGHLALAVEEGAFVDDELRRPDIPPHGRFRLEDELFLREDRSLDLAADRHVLGGDVSVHIAGVSDGNVLRRLDLADDLPVDADASRRAEFSLEDRPRGDEVELRAVLSFHR